MPNIKRPEPVDFNPPRRSNYEHEKHLLGIHGRGVGVCVHHPPCAECRAQRAVSAVTETP